MQSKFWRSLSSEFYMLSILLKTELHILSTTIRSIKGVEDEHIVVAHAILRILHVTSTGTSTTTPTRTLIIEQVLHD